MFTRVKGQLCVQLFQAYTGGGDHWEVWTIEGIDAEYENGKKIIDTYDLVAVKAAEVNW